MRKPSLLIIFLTVFIDLIGFGIVMPLLPLYSSQFGAAGWMNGGDCGLIFPDATVVLARELTKKFEEFLRGTAAALLALTKNRTLKGEFVVLVDRPISTAKSKVN